MRPPSAISGSSFWVRKKGPLSWMFTNWSNCSSVVSAKLAWIPMPALFTRKSRSSRPNSFRSRRPRLATKASKVAHLLTSSWSMAACPPRSMISRLRDSASSSLLW
ncbi:hypothetical protein D9M68_847120 [compost metagenome]